MLYPFREKITKYFTTIATVLIIMGMLMPPEGFLITLGGVILVIDEVKRLNTSGNSYYTIGE